LFEKAKYNSLIYQNTIPELLLKSEPNAKWENQSSFNHFDFPTVQSTGRY